MINLSSRFVFFYESELDQVTLELTDEKEGRKSEFSDQAFFFSEICHLLNQFLCLRIFALAMNKIQA